MSASEVGTDELLEEDEEDDDEDDDWSPSPFLFKCSRPLEEAGGVICRA